MSHLKRVNDVPEWKPAVTSTNIWNVLHTYPFSFILSSHSYFRKWNDTLAAKWNCGLSIENKGHFQMKKKLIKTAAALLVTNFRWQNITFN